MAEAGLCGDTRHASIEQQGTKRKEAFLEHHASRLAGRPRDGGWGEDARDHCSICRPVKRERVHESSNSARRAVLECADAERQGGLLTIGRMPCIHPLGQRHAPLRGLLAILAPLFECMQNADELLCGCARSARPARLGGSSIVQGLSGSITKGS